MSNYTHLTVCSSGLIPPPLTAPRQEYWDPYPPQRDNPPWYEAKYSIPLFWLCLFDARHLHSVDIPNEPEEDEDTPTVDAVPLLLAPQDQALANARRRRPLLAKVLPQRELDLYDAFTLRVEEDFAPFIIVLAEELAWMQDAPGDCAREMAETLTIMESLPPEEWTGHFAFANVAGFTPDKPMDDFSWYNLVGYDEHSDWPNQPQDPPKESDRPSPEVPTLRDAAEAGDAEPQGDDPIARKVQPHMRRLYDNSRDSEESLTAMNGYFIHSPYSPIFLKLLVVVPLGAGALGYFLSWWWLLSLPVLFIAYLMLVQAISPEFSIDLDKREFRRRKKQLPFVDVAEEQLRIVQQGKHHVVLLTHPQIGAWRVLSYVGPDARQKAENFLDALRLEMKS